MKHLIGLFLAAVIAVSVVPNARSLGAPAVPPGVTASDWIPLGDAAGFVVAREDSARTAISPLNGTVRGYFMVRRAGRWFRIDATPEYGVQKAGLHQ
jgi:hypothetical protein